MASWTIGPEQTVRIRARATRFTVVCDECARALIGDGCGAAAGHGPLLLGRLGGRFACLRGHHLRIERDLLS